MSDVATPVPRYHIPAANGHRAAFLVAARGTPSERWYPFFDTVEIGRDNGGVRDQRPGLLLVTDPTVSRSHCVLTYRDDGRCFVRDLSRNGTRVDGRRLVPNVEVELEPGQRVAVGDTHEFVVVFDGAGTTVIEPSDSTVAKPSSAMVTVLVGDIRDYAVLVRHPTSPEVQQSVRRVFGILSDAVGRNGGTVKEFQGDAIVAFWEGTFVGEQAVAACRTALHLDCLAERLAADRSVWRVDHFPLSLDWALATGPVTIDSFGGDRPAGLSVVGEAPVLAFRLEKFATHESGRILACRATRDRACTAYRFRDLGLMVAKGFDRPDHVYALEGELAEQRSPMP
jgi:class 3 adenylate cyclase